MLNKLLALTAACAPLLCHAADVAPLAAAVALANGYKVTPNLVYARAGGVDLKLDVYARAGAGPAQPVLMFIHGGGWVYGGKEMNGLAALPYLALGFAVVNIEYRLADTAPAPAALEDSLCALQWIGQHAGQYNFDVKKLVVAGESAGGHLALALGLMPTDTPFARACAWKERAATPTPKVAAVINWFGIADVDELLAGPNLRGYAVSWFGAMDGRGQLARRLSPLGYVHPGAGLPPVFTIHGEADPVVPFQQSLRLHQALDAAADKNRLYAIPGGGHGHFSDAQTQAAFESARGFLTENGVLPPR